MNRFADGKGLIIDVRDNGGGSMRNVYRLLGRFIPEKQVLGYMDYKTGPGPEAYSVRDSFVLLFRGNTAKNNRRRGAFGYHFLG